MNASNTITSTNVYVTPPGAQPVATPVHTDFTGNLMVHLNGRKHWKLWKKPGLWLPATRKFIVGRDLFDRVSETDLGEPYAEYDLEPGCVLYVPRGCFHETSTPPVPGSGANATVDEIVQHTSMHLTTHLAFLHDFGGVEQIMTTVVGGNGNKIFERYWKNSIFSIADRSMAMRKGLREVLD